MVTVGEGFRAGTGCELAYKNGRLGTTRRILLEHTITHEAYEYEQRGYMVIGERLTKLRTTAASVNIETILSCLLISTTPKTFPEYTSLTRCISALTKA